MGIIYDNNVPESELYSAYGMTVYGKENRYEWTIYPDRPEEKCYITLRIADDKMNDIFNIYLGNRCIFKENFDRTIDNFLWWIFQDTPGYCNIENQIFNSLVQSDSLFNHRIENRKMKLKKEQEENKREKERKQQEQDYIDQILDYCAEKYLIFYRGIETAVILKPLNDKARNIVGNAIRENNRELIESYINFTLGYPENKDLRITKRGTIKEIIEYIRGKSNGRN